MKRVILIYAILTIFCHKSKADIGWTLNQCIQHWGKPHIISQTNFKTVSPTYILEWHVNGKWIMATIIEDEVTMENIEDDL